MGLTRSTERYNAGLCYNVGLGAVQCRCDAHVATVPSLHVDDRNPHPVPDGVDTGKIPVLNGGSVVDPHRPSDPGYGPGTLYRSVGTRPIVDH